MTEQKSKTYGSCQSCKYENNKDMCIAQGLDCIYEPKEQIKNCQNCGFTECDERDKHLSNLLMQCSLRKPKEQEPKLDEKTENELLEITSNNENYSLQQTAEGITLLFKVAEIKQFLARKIAEKQREAVEEYDKEVIIPITYLTCEHDGFIVDEEARTRLLAKWGLK